MQQQDIANTFITNVFKDRITSKTNVVSTIFSHVDKITIDNGEEYYFKINKGFIKYEPVIIAGLSKYGIKSLPEVINYNTKYGFIITKSCGDQQYHNWTKPQITELYKRILTDLKQLQLKSLNDSNSLINTYKLQDFRGNYFFNEYKSWVSVFRD